MSQQDKNKKKSGRNIEIRQWLMDFDREHGGVELRDLYAAGYLDCQIKDMQSGKYTVRELLEMEPRDGRVLKILVTLFLAILLIAICYSIYVYG